MTIVIAEKQSEARIIAKALKAGKRIPYVSHGDMFYWETILNGDKTRITYTKGRLYELAPAAEYGANFEKWSSSYYPCIPRKFKYVPIQDNNEKVVSEYIECLEEAISQADKIICATDNDESGEIIFSYIYENIGRELPVYRAIINDNNEAAIRSAFSVRNLVSNDTRQCIIKSARCKDMTNWLWGVNLTVLATQAFGNREKITIGTVQTPTLAAVVNLEQSIRNHKAESGYVVKATFDKVQFPASLSQKFSSKDEAHFVEEKCKKSRAVITEYTEKINYEKKPLLYNTTMLQAEVCKRLKISPTKAADIMQKLYMVKLITYPRTEMPFLFESDKPEIEKVISSLFSGIYKGCALPKEKWCPFTDRHFNDERLVNEAHSAIVPKMPITEEIKRLTEQELMVYDMVCRSVLKLVYPDAEYLKISATISVGSYDFIAYDKSCIEPGWKIFVSESKYSGILSQYQKGSVVEGKYSCSEVVSKPPARFNYSSLMLYMESAGKYIEDEEMSLWSKKHRVMLGTNDTRPIIIQNLIDNEYIIVKKNTIYPTELGEYIIHNFPIEDLKKPDLVADMERRIYDVRLGNETPEKYMSTVIKKLTEWAVILKGVRIKEYVSEQESKYKCPVCGRQMKKSTSAWYCTGNFDKTCDVIIPLIIKQKRLTDKNVFDLITKGKTSVISGFKDEDGIEFASSLAYDRYNKTLNWLHEDENYVCPLCGGIVRKSKYAWYCTNKSKGCSFYIRTIIAQKPISEIDAINLMTTGKTDVIDGFINKKGKTFSCALAYNKAENKIDFIYPGKRRK